MDERFVTMHSLTQIIDRMYPEMITRQEVVKMLQMLKRHRKVSLKEIADLILYIADTSHREWNVEVILSGINESFESINWRGVYEKFVEEDLKIWNAEYLYTLVDCWVRVSGIITVPYEVFFRPWRNVENQIDFLRILLESDEKRTQVYSNIFFEKIVTKEEVHTSKFKKTLEYESNLNSVELFKCIRDLQARGLIDLVRAASPEYCALGLASVRPFCEDVFDDLFVSFCDSAASSFVLHMLFTKFQADILHVFRRVSDRISLTRILDIFLEHKMLPVVTEILEPKDLCFDIIILSSRRDHLNLEVWLSNNLDNCAEDFVDYLCRKLPLTGTGAAEPPKDDAEIFPFDRNLVGCVLSVLSEAKLSEALQLRVGEMKRRMLESSVLDRTSALDRATQFISEIINSHVGVDESIARLEALIRGDGQSLTFAKSVFGLLIDNYSSLYKLPNSDMLAVFFGELIKRRIFLKPFMKVALQLIKKSLSFPDREREYAFAFCILEVFLADNPEFFAEIESIETVRTSLIRKEMILVDESSQTGVELDTLLEVALNREGLAEYARNEDRDWKELCRRGDGKKKDVSVGIEAYLARFTTAGASESGSVDDGNAGGFPACGEEKYPRDLLLVFHMLRSLPKNQQFFMRLAEHEGPEFCSLLVSVGFKTLTNSFLYRIEDEAEYFRRLGTFLGALTIAKNKMISLDAFDFKSFILKCIEYRRITVCVYFTAHFLREGKRGILYVPHNPWLMAILDLLAELYVCTLVSIRTVISDVFEHFGLKMVVRPVTRTKEYLVKYVVSYDGVLRQVISAALDFSVREISNKVVRSSLGVTKVTAVQIFKRIIRGAAPDTACAGCSSKHDACEDAEACGGIAEFFRCGARNFFIFRNLFVNLSRALVHISAQEPLKASICGNVTHFLKLSMNELAPDEIYQIAMANLKGCCAFIEKVCVTQVNEIAPDVYKEMLRELETESSMRMCTEEENGPATIHNMVQQMGCVSNLDIISESRFVEKTHVRSIENAEYQEIKSYLLQLGRRMPLRRNNFIGDEWPLLLGENRDEHVKSVILFLESAPDRDAQCLSICKYLVGHAIKVGCRDAFLFDLIVRVFEISPKTKREVVGWLIYSDDSKRHNILLIRTFVEYDLINLEEFDQALSRSLKSDDLKAVSFVLDLLAALMLGSVQLCTVYDFIHTIETLNRMNDNPRVFDFFKHIELGMMKFADSSDTSFDTALKTIRLNAPPAAIRAAFSAKYTLNLPAAFKAAWHHFVLYTGAYRFFKVDLLAVLAKDALQPALKEALGLLVQAYSKRHYLFFMFFCRFLCKVLDEVDDTPENRVLFFKLLELLVPSSLPGFAAQFFEVIDHRFVTKFLARGEAFFLYRELLELLAANARYEQLVTAFFVKNNSFTKKYNLYLSYLCPSEYPALKNLFNQTRAGAVIEKASNPFFAAYYNLSKHLSVSTSYDILIDNLNEHNSVTIYALDRLASILDLAQGAHREEIVLALLIRRAAANTPQGIVLACEELFARPKIREIADRYNELFFKDSIK
ncbi:CCR4-NOT transcription complex subunit 1 [Pancytospora philotis]|nr:CCR4-NOT transcription complex subunit 1 [Pancytospora philotis]